MVHVNQTHYSNFLRSSSDRMEKKSRQSQYSVFVTGPHTGTQFRGNLGAQCTIYRLACKISGAQIHFQLIVWYTKFGKYTNIPDISPPTLCTGPLNSKAVYMQQRH